jgi:hypothetical protein
MKPTQAASRCRAPHGHHPCLRAIVAIFCLGAISADAHACDKPEAGKPIAVATAAAAIAAAKEAWRPIYSKAPQHSAFSPESISQGEPYVATLESGVWHVVGTLPKGTVGGAPEASICEVDGSVSATSHGQ